MSGMINQNLIIADDLVEPPSEILPLRTVTMISHVNMELSILLHTTQEMKDLYYHWMKPRGLMDYINYIINETEFEEGIRLDTAITYPHTIVTKYIRIENQLNILGKIQAFKN